MKSLATALGSSMDRMGRTLEVMQRQGESDKHIGEGTMGYLKTPLAKNLLYLAQGCGELEVDVCENCWGRDLFDGLKRAGECARSLLVQVR